MGGSGRVWHPVLCWRNVRKQSLDHGCLFNSFFPWMPVYSLISSEIFMIFVPFTNYSFSHLFNHPFKSGIPRGLEFSWDFSFSCGSMPWWDRRFMRALAGIARFLRLFTVEDSCVVVRFFFQSHWWSSSFKVGSLFTCLYVLSSKF